MRRHTIKQPKGPAMAAIISPPSQAHNKKLGMVASLMMGAHDDLTMAGVVMVMLMVI